MLQQTTVAAVRGRFDAFLARFPDLSTLARARLSTVLAAWSGLGYYARARNLHAAARRIAARHGGRMPRDPEALSALPGFGDYMAAAVASLAFGARVPAVDANVARVVSRLFAVGGAAGGSAHAATVRRHVASLLPRRRPGDLTAALMDLGQQICMPRRPRCDACPIARLCRARALGAPEDYPRRRSRPRARRVRCAAAVALSGGKTLVIRGQSALLRGLWLFPLAEGGTTAAARTQLARSLRLLDLRLFPGAPIAVARHTMVHRLLEIRVYRAARLSSAEASGLSHARWLTPEQLARAPIPTLTRKIAAAAGCLPAAHASDTIAPAS
jgi:A/G-specific adenine glycosylase